ncbi:MAG TPA: preprotein translocase subunit SecG [Tepidisphaeraceae bacterium]|nr:preprotein translocase subunit SecG [Tepidisphaeraceae bacterium]
MTSWFYVVMTVFIFVSFILTMLILIQKGRGGGLSGAFGGGGGGHTPFGTKTGDVLTWATSIIFGIFLFLAIVLNWIANAKQKQDDSKAAKTAIVMPLESDNWLG